jgi:hypothetical protein
VATLRTRTVKSSGGDYTSLAAAEAGEQGDIVSSDEQVDIECYASAAGDSSQVTINGWTTDATHYLRIVCPAGERHAGVWDAAKYYLGVTTSGAPGGALTNFENYTRVEFLQIRNLRSSPPEYNDCVYSDCVGAFLNGLILRDGYRGCTFENGAGRGNRLRNVLAYGGSRAGAIISGSSSGYDEADNCTLIGGTYGLDTLASVNYPRARNVYAHGSTSGYGASAGGLVTKTNCAASDTSATNNSGGGGATNCVDSVAHNTTQFTNVTGGSEDYRLPAGSGLIDVGLDLSGTFTTDIVGETRGATWDIGADEYVAGGAVGHPTWKRFGGVAFAARGNPGVW